MARLMRYDDAFVGDKFLVRRRDGSVVEWPHFTLGARDPAAIAALNAYAVAAEALGFEPRFVADVRLLAAEFEDYRLANGPGDPDSPRHREDDPDVVARMEADGAPIGEQTLARLAAQGPVRSVSYRGSGSDLATDVIRLLELEPVELARFLEEVGFAKRRLEDLAQELKPEAER